MLPESVRQSTKKFLANVVVNFTGVLIGILGFVGIGWVAAGLATVSLGVVLGTQYYLTYRPPVQKRDQQLSTFFDDYLGKAGEEIESVAGDDIEVRCNVMRPTAGGVVGDDRLEISFTADRDEYRPDELELEFKPGQGCAGAVYRQGKQQIAVRERRGEWPDGFETTPRQDNATDHLQVIIGTPVYRPNDDPAEANPAAVFVIDSESEVTDVLDIPEERATSEIEIKNTRVCNLATEYSEKVGILL